MRGQGMFQTIRPAKHRLLPFLLMLASGFLGLALAVPGIMGGCVLMIGQLTPLYEGHAFWVRTLGHVLFGLWVVPVLIAAVSLVWTFVGVTLRHVVFAAALMLVCLAPYIVWASMSAPHSGPIAPGTAACGDTM